ncbi:MAG: CBS domain-containing protein [Acidimicrobiia bacterium]|nr:CBS domain-containing protein [Acidimicrobiia bacterium]
MRRLQRVRDLIMGAATDSDTTGLALLSLVVGFGVGLGTAAMVWSFDAVHWVVRALGIGDGSFWLFLLIPVGFVTAWAIARHIAPEVAGDGVPETIASLLLRGGRMRHRSIPAKLAATALTVGVGGSGGREGPVVQLGSSIASVIATKFKLGEHHIRSLVAAGAGAAIGATFNAPIAGMLFAMEVILSSFAVRHMSAIVIASVSAAVTSRLLVGDELAMASSAFTLGDPRELAVYLGLALVVAVIGVGFLWLLDRTERTVEQYRELGVLVPVGTGVLVAALVVFEPALGGTGQDGAESLLTGGLLADAWWIMLLLALGKALATALTISSGGSGGAFMPSLFMGAAIGAAIYELVEPIWDISSLPLGGLVLVGMATMFAVVGRAPLTAILLVFEVTGARDYGLILPLMLSATVATLIADRLHPASAYTMPLIRRGIHMVKSPEVDVLDSVTVGEVMSQPPFVASADTSVARVQSELDARRSHGTVVAEGRRVLGVATMTDLAKAEGDTNAVPVSKVMTVNPFTVHPTDQVSHALEVMASLGVGRLPVVDTGDDSALIGMFRREDAVNAYHLALGQRTDHALSRHRLTQRTDPGTGYFDFRVPFGSIADGRMVREVGWPEGVTLVSIRRGREVIVPNGLTLLGADDVVTAFGSEGAQRATILRMDAGVEDDVTAEIILEWDGGEEE